MKKNEISLPWQVAETLKERILLKKEYSNLQKSEQNRFCIPKLIFQI